MIEPLRDPRRGVSRRGDRRGEVELDSPFDLIGLYRGVALPHKSITGPSFAITGAEPDMVFLYRRPILDYWCEEDETLEAVVRHVLIHEIGHHLGFSDEDMERIEEAEEHRLDAGAQFREELGGEPRVGALPECRAPARVRQYEIARQEVSRQPRDPSRGHRLRPAATADSG